MRYTARPPPERSQILKVNKLKQQEVYKMILTQNVIVLSVNQFRITKDNSNEVENEGSTVRYLLSDDLTHCEDTAKAVKGYRPAKVTLLYEDYHKFQEVPALYEAIISYNVDSSGNAKVAPQEFKFLSGITVSKPTSGNKFNLKKDEQ